ncbi:hypothetical protein [Propionibacterium freudenreichii]|uniref:hypothetical protein n=1 Tax=Propionibacterium freudenreichii TaxID=1744 RepID=UPI00255192D7|nr:hypothetical protein [Propionibacterium freudenreichii]MDK9627016.1 hypothetical protein [Propionibacterium freudenreichii]
MNVDDLIIRLDPVDVQIIDGSLTREQRGPDDQPCLIITGGTTTPRHRLIDGTTAAAAQTWRVLASSNGPAGARHLAHQVTRLLDGWRMNRATMRVQLVSEPIEDRDDPTDYRWSATVEATIPTSPVRSFTP